MPRFFIFIPLIVGIVILSLCGIQFYSMNAAINAGETPELFGHVIGAREFAAVCMALALLALIGMLCVADGVIKILKDSPRRLLRY